MKNRQEHLHGSDPLDRASTGAISLTLDAGHLRCIFTRLSSPASGIPVRCEAGRAMNDWDSPETEERIISSENGIETIESRLPHGTNPRGFIRLRYGMSRSPPDTAGVLLQIHPGAFKNLNFSRCAVT